MNPHGRAIVVGLALASVLIPTHHAASQEARAKHVVIVGVDGLSPDGIRKAKTPVLHDLMTAGASTLHARAVMPTVSAPNWASMIMGAGPEQHGVVNNDWKPGATGIVPTSVLANGRFPTIFDLIRSQHPSAKVGCFHDWDGFGVLFDHKAVDEVVDGAGPAKTMEAAIAYIKKAKPELTFIHLDHVDDAGHEHGHGTPEYYRAVEEADRLIGRLLEALKEAGIDDDTVVLVTSDHGGVGKKHGGSTMAEIEIPWIIRGRGVVAGKELATPVNTYDTAATAAAILGLEPPKCWIARPVVEAFTPAK